jgi:hypothetical protein
MRFQSRPAADPAERRLVKVVLLAALVGVGICSVALATAQFKSTFALSYLSVRPGASTGLTTLMTWSDPGAAGGAPKVIKQITLRFQPGTVLDTSALPACHASDHSITTTRGSACPADTKLGSGSTIGATAAGARFNTVVTLFNATRQIIVLVTLGGVPVTEFRDRVQRTAIIVRPALPTGVSLERLALRIGPHSRGRGAARKVYMRNPSSCPNSRRWKIVGTFSYVDNSSQTLTSTTPCRPR